MITQEGVQCKNVLLFIRSKTDILNVVIFKYSLHTIRETILHRKQAVAESVAMLNTFMAARAYALKAIVFYSLSSCVCIEGHCILLPLRTPNSEVSERNSIKLCHIFGSDPDLKRDDKNLGILFPLNVDIFVYFGFLRPHRLT